MLRTALVTGLLTALALPAYADPVIGKEAPAWSAVGWVNLQRGRSSLQPTDLRGRVVYVVLYAPDDAANARALRAVARLRSRYGRTVAFVALQTDAPSKPRPTQLAYLAQYQLRVPAATEWPIAGRPTIRDRYGAGTGPWAVLIDARGIVRASRPVRPAGDEVRAIEALRAPPSNPLVGTAFGSLSGLRWLQPSRPVAFAESGLTLLRWWTTNCPHCTASVPSLSGLANKYAARGLRFVGVYHRKSAFRVSDASIRSAFQRLGGAPHALAVDEGWRMLRPFMQRGRLRQATSISILVDQQGVIQWVHPGPRIHTSRATRYAGPARDLAALDAFLNTRLPAASATGSAR